MTDHATLIALTGTDQAAEAPRLLAAGKLTAELVAGNLRAIRWRGAEVLRGIAYVVRDRQWGTLAPDFADVAIEEGEGGFAVRYRARCASPDGAVLAFSAAITGAPDGTLAFEATAEPEDDFETNRCGFCILHPIREVAGRSVSVEHVDGSVDRATMPDLIDPWQSFKDIQAITHEVLPGLSATCRMEGDSFEMEDQRNWSDASYKTYVRPLARPWPYVLPRGIVQRQAVRLTLAGERDAGASRGTASGVIIRLGEPVGRMPGIGLAVTLEECPAVLAAAARLRALAPQSLLFHFDATAAHGLAALRGFAEVQALHGCEAVLECVLACDRPPGQELDEVARLVQASGLRLDAIAVSPAVDRQSVPPGGTWPACPPLDEVYAAARRAFPGLRLGGGTFSTFTELNRKRPPVGLIDFVTHTTNPLVHAADDRSVMETLEALPAILRSVRAIAGADKPYRIGPSTIGMRHNPYGAGPLDNPLDRRLCMARRDPRQRGLFAAAWLIGYAAQTAGGDLDMLTVGALTGDFGLVEGAAVRPVFHAARGLVALAGQARLACVSDAEDRVLGVAACRPGAGTTLWLANLTDRGQRVEVAGGADWQASILHHATMGEAADGTAPPALPLQGGVEMPPYAVVRLTGG